MSSPLSRRAIFARLRGGPVQLRPPWSKAEGPFTDTCTQCGKCIAACPTGILSKGHAGYPIVVFNGASCTFCGACVQACPEDCFEPVVARPAWGLKAAISPACVETKGVACRMCQEACDRDAIRFRPKLGGGSTPVVARADCTGCGACVGPCPVKAISIDLPESMEATA